MKYLPILMLLAMIASIGSVDGVWSDEAHHGEHALHVLPAPGASADQLPSVESPVPLGEISFGRVFQPSPHANRQIQPHAGNVPRDPYVGAAVPNAFGWVGPAMVHRTLYFEEPALERQGWTRFPLLQPTISWWKFCWNAATVPVRSHDRRPHDIERARP